MKYRIHVEQDKRTSTKTTRPHIKHNDHRKVNFIAPRMPMGFFIFATYFIFGNRPLNLSRIVVHGHFLQRTEMKKKGNGGRRLQQEEKEKNALLVHLSQWEHY